MAKNRSRRLRKKLYTDEFTVLGFEFSCTVATEKDSDYEELMDSFVDFIESENLITGAGGSSNSFGGFIVPVARYSSATESDRVKIERWLSEHPLCSKVKVGELVDANT